MVQCSKGWVRRGVAAKKTSGKRSRHSDVAVDHSTAVRMVEGLVAGWHAVRKRGADRRRVDSEDLERRGPLQPR